MYLVTLPVPVVGGKMFHSSLLYICGVMSVVDCTKITHYGKEPPFPYYMLLIIIFMRVYQLRTALILAY